MSCIESRTGWGTGCWNASWLGYLRWASRAALFVVGAPHRVGALRVAAGAAPVPLATITEDGVYPQRRLQVDLQPVHPVGARFLWHGFAREVAKTALSLPRRQRTCQGAGPTQIQPQLWLFIVAPVAGGVLAALIWRYSLGKQAVRHQPLGQLRFAWWRA